MTISEAEARRRLPVDLVEDVDLRARTVEAIAAFPAYFWTAPATSSDRYHNQYARGERGLWIHVAMAATALERVVDSHVEQGRLSDRQADLARAAVLLHDGRKFGDRWRQGQSADRDHDLRMADVVRRRGFPEPVAQAIASHMGPWYDGPQPSTPLEQVVHQADMVASARHVTPAVYDPPAELLEAQPDLPRCSPDAAAPRRDGRDADLAEFSGGGGR